MALTILDDSISSDRTAHSAWAVPGKDWEVSWLPGRPLTRNGAITAMTLAEVTAPGGMDAGHRLWPHIEGWAAELGLTGSEALTWTTVPPGRTITGKNAELADPEAGG